MSYNSRDYARVKNEFENKYRIARAEAESRMAEIHALIPEVFEIDRTLSHTGLDIMNVITSGARDTDAEIARLEARNNELIARREALLSAHGFSPDYTDVHYECEKCGDSGFVDTHMCECMKRALVREGFESSGLGQLIGKQTFDNFDTRYYGEDAKRLEGYKNTLCDFAESFAAKRDKNFLLIGGTGLGKTHLSTAVAQKVIEGGFDVLYVSAVTLLGDFEQNRFGSSGASASSNETHRYYSADLLIIDDLGTEVVNKFTQSCIYELINTRINMRRSTIINTNLYPKDIAATYTERISSRLLGEYMPMLFTGKDIRRQRSV